MTHIERLVFVIGLATLSAACQQTKISAVPPKPVAAPPPPASWRPPVNQPVPVVPVRPAPPLNLPGPTLQNPPVSQPVPVQPLPAPTTPFEETRTYNPPPRTVAQPLEDRRVVQPVDIPLPQALPTNHNATVVVQAPRPVVPVPLPRPAQVTCAENGTCPPEPKEGSCSETALGAKQEGDKLDILFVLDTSASLRGGVAPRQPRASARRAQNSRRQNARDANAAPVRNGDRGELVQIAREITNFIGRLDARTSYRIGLLLGHGPGSPHHAKLFSFGSDDQAVIDFATIYEQEKRAGGQEEDIRKRVEVRITQTLINKMENIPNDRTSAQGEALLLNLYNAVNTPDHFQAITQAGLFRPDAALAVIMISDEQDVCWDYRNSPEFSPRLKRVETRDSRNRVTGHTNMPDRHETRFFNEVCSKAVNGQPLEPGHVFDALKAKKGDKLIVTGVVYTNNNIPVGVEDENEMGHGILQLIQLANGKVADLANVDRSNNSISFAKELSFLGEFTQFRMQYKNSFICRTPIHPAAIDPSTVELNIFNGSGQPVARFSGRCLGQGSCPQANGPVESRILESGQRRMRMEFVVADQILRDILERQNVREGKVRIQFKTHAHIDERTGQTR